MRLALLLTAAVTASLFATCRSTNSSLLDRPNPIGSTTPTVAGKSPYYLANIKPIFDKKCIACHACNQSPCQVNLTSFEGVRRGALKLNAYAKRLTKADPQRMGIDGLTEADWRQRGFFPIVGDPNASILWEMVNLKKDYPQEQIKETPEKILLNGDMCQSLNDDHGGDINQFREHFRDSSLILRRNKREYGMPYGLPALTQDETDKVKTWIEDGAPGPTDAEQLALTQPKDAATKQAISTWETFFNGQSLKEQLTARYIYEHLFFAHIYFGDDKGGFAPGAEDEFYRLVRSGQQTGPLTTVSGSRHPYDAANLGGRFYYRLQKINQTIVHKSHMSYEFNQRRMNRFKELFLDPAWQATAMPAYGTAGSNPFTTFKDIPAWARYQFLLDDALYFTRTDIRGPVCNGKLAVNVIQDHGWRVYLKPTSDVSVMMLDFFTQTNPAGQTVAELLAMPAQTQSSTIEAAHSLFTRKFREKERAYLEVKDKLSRQFKPKLGAADLWVGDGNGHHNLRHGRDNYGGATQTIMRHFDSANVEPGLLGEVPKTFELADYTLLERGYYNLVAGFDVYGSTIDGANTRSYKDAIRIETEDMFLRLAPAAYRVKMREYVYDARTRILRGKIRDQMEKYNPLLPAPGPENETLESFSGNSDRSGEELAAEVFQHYAAYFRGKSLGWADFIHCQGCGPHPRQPDPVKLPLIQQFAQLRTSGPFAKHFPEVTFLKIGDHAFSLLARRFRTNTKYLLGEILTRKPSRDQLMVVDHLVGSYPNLFMSFPEAKLAEFLSEIGDIKSKRDFENFRNKWATSRSDAGIYDLNQWFYQHERQRNPIEAAHYDLSRYEIFY